MNLKLGEINVAADGRGLLVHEIRQEGFDMYALVEILPDSNVRVLSTWFCEQIAMTQLAKELYKSNNKKKKEGE